MAKPQPDYDRVDLSPAQSQAADALRETVKIGEAGVTILEGVTGSGKTEVYFEALAQCFERGKQALVLLPEIALTSSFLERFENRFGTRPAEWHSELAPKNVPGYSSLLLESALLVIQPILSWKYEYYLQTVHTSNRESTSRALRLEK